MLEFQAFRKIPRLSREMVITEKIDGTNAQVWITPVTLDGWELFSPLAVKDGLGMYAGSRSGFIRVERDNFGFAQWVKNHADELWGLGEGRHFGEWYGAGIQRKYGLNHRRWALFNVSRWRGVDGSHALDLPPCCEVVPVLYRGPFNTADALEILESLRSEGSYAVPGYMNPEGIVIWHSASNQLFKKTFEGDEGGKEAQERMAAMA